ncbi:MAG: phosphatase PAP2 family protein [Gemmatimonadota bacterium]
MGVGALHMTAYYFVNRLNAARPPSAFWNLWTPLDDAIPGLPWTWPFYWALYPYLTLGAAWVVWRLPSRAFRRAILAYGGMSLVGAAIQLAVPATAPWPANASSAQTLLHGQSWVKPYACLPSMHVALSTLTASLAVLVLGSRPLRILYVVTATLICLSTLTLREHYLLDVVAGGLLAGVTVLWWSSSTAASRAASPRLGRPQVVPD